MAPAGVPEPFPGWVLEGLRAVRLSDDALSEEQLYEVLRRVDAAGLEELEVSFDGVPTRPLRRWSEEEGWSERLMTQIDEVLRARDEIAQRAAAHQQGEQG